MVRESRPWRGEDDDAQERKLMEEMTKHGRVGLAAMRAGGACPKLPAIARYAEEIAQNAEREGWTFGRYLHNFAELEVHERRRRRIERYLDDSDLPREKTLATLTRSRLPPKVAKTLPTLCEGGFVERGDNVLAFGPPGRRLGRRRGARSRARVLHLGARRPRSCRASSSIARS